MRLALALGVAMACAIGAGAAELPSRAQKDKPSESKAKTCEIDGERGVVTPFGGCVRIGGYVTLGVSSGNLKH